MASGHSVIAKYSQLVLLMLCSLQLEIIQAGTNHGSNALNSTIHDDRGGNDQELAAAIVPRPIRLSYRGGTIFSGNDLPVYIIWYGRFSPWERSHILDFFASFKSSGQESHPSVSSWWALTADYKDGQGSSVSSAVELKQELFDDYSMGWYLSEDHIEGLLWQALHNTFPIRQKAFFLVLTAEDVYVDGFCTQRCASHFTTQENLMRASPDSIQGQKTPYAWVGNAATQCPGICAWPFATGEYGYTIRPLKPPSGHVGAEGMIINIAAMLACVATNPFNSGFFQGDEDLPLEAAAACTGMFGPGAYSGYPGLLRVDTTTGTSFNAHGINNRKYLLPALWSPVNSSCSNPAS